MKRFTVFLFSLLMSACFFSGCSGSREAKSTEDSVDAGGKDGAGPDQVFSIEQHDQRLIVDPYGVAPLSAMLVISDARLSQEQIDEVHISFLDPEHAFSVVLDYNDEHYARDYLDPDLLSESEIGVPLLGLVPDVVNAIDVSIVTADATFSTQLRVRPAAIDVSLPSISIERKDESKMEPGFNMAAFYGLATEHLARPLIYDHQGVLRWLLLLDRAISPGFITPVERLKNGNWILGISNVIYEYNMLGREVERWVLPIRYKQHHDIFEMPSGNFLVTVTNSEASILDDGEMIPAINDHVLEVKRDTGQIVNLWNLSEFLDVDRDDLTGADNDSDWLHLNSMIYSADDDSIVISGKHQGLAKITRGGEAGDQVNKNKHLVWILAPHVGWNKAGAQGNGMDLAPYLLSAVDEQGVPYVDDIQNAVYATDEFEWSFGQHAPLILPNSHLFVFDNGTNRDMGDFLFIGYSRGVEYEIRPSISGLGGTVHQVWQYGKERGQELYAPVISDVDVGASTGNRFIMPGSYTQKPNGDVGEVARMVEVAYPNKEVVFEAHLRMQGAHPWESEICYRQERLSLYPYSRAASQSPTK
ncbi:MAG: aryl-sulfate sulfotransferase [Myxococcales bacterium]|nr:MAG: aryl-sulfate sulfotransferase [Myxococcales bacterium]